MVDIGLIRRFIKGAVAGMTVGALLGAGIVLLLDVTQSGESYLIAIPLIIAILWGGIRVARNPHPPSAGEPQTA